MFAIIPETETRFWSIFRCLLTPLAVVSLLMCLVAAIATALGENTPVIDGRQIRGIEGVFVCLAAFPFLVAFFTFAFACAGYLKCRKTRRP
jgi:hypothetical protein